MCNWVCKFYDCHYSYNYLLDYFLVRKEMQSSLTRKISETVMESISNDHELTVSSNMCSDDSGVGILFPI